MPSIYFLKLIDFVFQFLIFLFPGEKIELNEYTKNN